MNKQQQKAFSEAYDKLYDLNSAYGYFFNKEQEALEVEAKKNGYVFVLNQRTQKWKMKEVKA